MSERSAHLVGTIPVATAAEAVDLAAEHLGGAMRWLPDGETGDRNNWVIGFIESLREHPALELVRDGDWSDYDATPQLRIRRGQTLRADALDMGYVRHFRASRPEFHRAAERIGVPGLAFQIGIPSPFDLAAFTLGPRGPVLHRRPFHEATVREITEIRRDAGDEVVFQIEVPVELVSVARAPSRLRALAAWMMAGPTVALARDAPPGTRFGVHLCLGDMEHRSLIEMADVGPVVALANAIAARWPRDRALEFVHAPFSGASQPPPTDPAFYAPLGGLRLPGRTRFVAGFVFEHQPLEAQRTVQAMIETAYGRSVDVSAACGMGRRSLEETVASMRQARTLVDDAGAIG